MEKKKRACAPAVDRALDVIELMAASERDLSLSEILKGVNIPRQSLIRILNTLCEREIVNKTEQRGFYRLGTRLLYLGDCLRKKVRSRFSAWPIVWNFAEGSSKTVDFSTSEGD